jgi:2-phospho-L-lactate guanylyltransferase
VPGDVPLIAPDDLLTIYGSAPEPGSVIVPSRDKRGTNAILRRPAALFSLRFGNDSFMPHLGAAIATHTTSLVLSLPRLALDIDTPEDLQELVQAPGEKRSQRLARKFGFPSASGAACLPEVEEARRRPVTAKM